MAIKIYDIQLEKDRKSIDNEIQIMTLLSNRSSPDNCFLELYDCKIEGNNRIILYMEAHDCTLMDILCEKKARNNKFDEDLLHILIIKLIQAYAEMAALNIYHRDINPNNILYTSEDNLKIIDFGISEKVASMDVTISTTGIHQIQGTAGYWAPEL